MDQMEAISSTLEFVNISELDETQLNLLWNKYDRDKNGVSQFDAL